MVRRLMRGGNVAMRRRGMARMLLLVLVHMGVMMRMMQSLVPLVQILQMDLPSLRRQGWQSGWHDSAAAIMQKLPERVVERLLQVSIHVLSVCRSLVKVLNRGRGGSRTAAFRVSVVGQERTSVQSDRMVGTSNQRGLERRERNIRTTGSLRVAQSQVLRSRFCPAGFQKGKRKNERREKRQIAESHTHTARCPGEGYNQALSS